MFEEHNDMLKEMLKFDHRALQLILEKCPDPVVARLLNLAGSQLKGSLYGALDRNRMDQSIRTLVVKEMASDPEKDMIVKKVLIRFANELLEERTIKFENGIYNGVD